MKTSRFIILFSILLIAFKVGEDKSGYLIPIAPLSITTADLMSDGDIDIIIGHMYSFTTEWGGYSTLDNDGLGYFVVDTQYLYGNHFDIFAEFVDNNYKYELITQFTENNQSHIGVVHDFTETQNNIQSYPLDYFADFMAVGDVSGNNSVDILFANNNNFLWGILYNDGIGSFSAPEYYDLSFPPVDIACGDLNNDGRADVVVCGSDTEIYFSTETGFQQQVLTTTLSHDVLISDFDNDGDNDVITHTTFTYPNHRVYMFENLGNSQFLEYDYFQFTPFCSYAQIADFNNDSLPDMVFIGFDYEGLYIYENKGGFQLEVNQFIPVDNYGGSLRRIACADFDGNLLNDIAIIRGTGVVMPYNVEIIFNDGSWNFLPDPITNINLKTYSHHNFICYPNPFLSDVTFEIQTVNNSRINISIFDIQGKEVFGLTKTTKGGINFYNWNGISYSGKPVDPGIYFARFIINETDCKTIKIIKY